MSMESTRCLLSEFSFKIRKSGKKSGYSVQSFKLLFLLLFSKKKCRCHAFANCEFLLFQVKNGTNLHASNVNISACGRFIKLPITPLSQNVMDWAVKLQYNLGEMQSEAKNTQKHAFWLEIDGNWLFLRSKTPISQVLDIETKNGRKFWKIWEKI